MRTLSAEDRFATSDLILRDLRSGVTGPLAPVSQARAEQRRLERVLEHCGEGIVLVGRDGRVTYRSPGGLRLLGRQAEEDRGRPALDDVHPDDQPALLQVLLPGAVYEGRVRLRHADGSWRWVEGVLRNLFDDPTVGALLGTYRDVSAEVEARRQLDALTAELERRVAERTVELEAANRELDAFSASVSHDLRAPLRAVLGFTRIVREEHAAILPADAQRQLDKVVAAGGRMEALIDGLLELSRTARGELRRRPVDLTAMATQVADELAQGEPGRCVQWAIAARLTATADPSLAYVMLENLLGNAWKYTRPRAVAEIAIGRAGGAYFVRDNGVGFDMADAQRLFLPFQRLHDASQFEGSGVGLATVQRIVARHGGRVWAESAPGEGTTLFFTLAPAASPVLPRKPRRGRSAAGH